MNFFKNFFHRSRLIPGFFFIDSSLQLEHTPTWFVKPNRNRRLSIRWKPPVSSRRSKRAKLFGLWSFQIYLFFFHLIYFFVCQIQLWGYPKVTSAHHSFWYSRFLLLGQKRRLSLQKSFFRYRVSPFFFSTHPLTFHSLFHPNSMDSRVAILGANGAGKSTLLHLITGALQPCEGTISKHSALKLAKYSQHSADQLPYDQSPIEYFQSLFSLKYPEKDIMVKFIYFYYRFFVVSWSFFFLLILLGVACTIGSIWSFWSSSNCAY